ncbi:MAG: PVC-type heme-binding CxxCH protein [Pirellula sp.]
MKAKSILLGALALLHVTAANSFGQDSSHWTSSKLSPLFWAEGGTAADLDGDGHMDVIAGPKVFFGPDYKVEKDLVDCKPYSIIGYSQFFFAFDYDVDKDSLVDVVIVGFPGQEAYWCKNPGGTKSRTEIWSRHVILAQVDNESPMLTDVTGDGVPELVCCNSGCFGFAEIPANPLDPWTFTPVSTNNGYQRFTHGIGVGDVNDDGRLDVMSKDGWWEHPEQRSAEPWGFHAYQFSEPGGAQMYAVDLDGDGKTEVITSLAAHGFGLAVYQKSKTKADEWVRIDIMTEKAETSPTGLAVSQLHAIDLADMDGDGKLDIVTGKRFWAHNGSDRGENEPAILVWFKAVASSSGLRFIPNIVDTDSGVGTQITIKDINSDGKNDIVSVSKRGVHLLVQKPGEAPSEPELGVAEKVVTIADSLGGFRPAWADDKPMNVDFEAGDLRHWSESGAAFFNQPIRGDAVAARRNDMTSAHQGEFWIGSYEVAGDIALGTLTSEPFKLSQPWVSFLQGGGSGSATKVDIMDAESGEVIATSRGANTEAMKRAVLNLERAKGKTVRVRLTDNSKDGWGHINFDDFRLHATEPAIPENERLPAFDQLSFRSLTPDKAAEEMILPDGFRAQVIASEPAVRQPIAMTIDHKGRVWVAEAYQYPIRAAGDEGKDRVLIFEDTNADGTLDSSKVFADNLNLVSGIEVGFGGLWVGAAPYLLFLPDENGDDVPDGPARKVLDGWGLQDTHETLNSFIWGPDGWLYGCHGIFTHSNVRVLKKDGNVTNGTPINAGIWRYHPQSETFEVFAHGTSNPWGVDFNDTGDVFLTACVIPHLYHIIPMARYQRQAGQHFNPYTYADIVTIAKHRHWLGDNPHAGNNRSDSAGGGHAHSGAMIYLGGSWPDKYRNQIFMNNIHGARLNQDQLTRSGSGYSGDRAPDFLLTNDQSSQILYFRSGPDGQVIAIDWYDAHQCHTNDPANHDQSNGRIYRIAYNNAKPVQVDLSKASDSQLVAYQLDKNDWYVRTARRLLMERASANKLASSTVGELRKLLDHAEGRIKLRGLWALAACQKLTATDLEKALRDSDEHVRGWGVRLLVQPTSTTNPTDYTKLLNSGSLAKLAATEKSALVRLELASAAQRIEPKLSLGIVSSLMTHGEDSNDHNQPLMVWYAVSRLLETIPAEMIAQLNRNQIPIVGEFAARQIAQVWLAEVNDARSASLVQLMTTAASTKDTAQSTRMLDSILRSLEGKRTTDAPKGWESVSKLLINHRDSNVRMRGAQLASKFNDAAALETLRTLVRNKKSEAAERASALNILKQVQASGLKEIGFELIHEPELRAAAVSAIADSLDEASAKQLVTMASKWETAADRRGVMFALLRRSGTTKVLLDAIESKTIRPSELTADMVQQIQRLSEPSLMEKVTQVWGNVRTLDQDKQKAVLAIKKIVESEKPEIDLQAGQAVFKKICGQCHVLFGEGGKIGPELTGSNRRDINYLLENIMDPSAVMAKEYQPWIVRTVDDQVFTGLLREATESSIRLQTATEEVVIYTQDIDEKKQSEQSMMPADLLGPLSEAEIKTLFDYLRSNGPK